MNLYQWESIQWEINIKETYIMTTITNFLHSNFANSSQKQHKQDHQVPIWVVNGTRSKNILALKQYIIDNCVASNKPLLHLDLGISVLKTVRNAHQRISICNGLDLVAVFKDKPCYILTMSSQFRQNTQQFLSIVIKTLNNIQEQLKNFKNTQIANNKGYSLIVEGLQIIGSEKKSLTSLQSFINRLSSLNQIFKQISIFKHEGILSPDHQFSLERISTCVTDIQKYQSNGVWVVKSTVRRYTGHSNQQIYTINTQKNGKFKVEKWVPPKQESQTQTQRQMLNDLGFVVKKGESIKDEGIKKMIYPHLRMQNTEDCKGNKSECKKCEQPVKPEDEGLIILDDEQQDDDDIDV